MGLFDDSDILSNRTFSWALGPYFVPPTDLTEFPDDVSKISLFVDANGTINVDEQLYLFKDTDPIDALSMPTWSKTNNFIKSLQREVGVPMYSIIVYPWYKINKEGLEKIKWPNDTPEGFVPCNGWKYTIDGVDYYTPNLVSRDETSGAGEGSTTETVYIAPPGTAYMIKLPVGDLDGAAQTSIFGQEQNVSELGGDLVTWGNPQSPLSNTFFFG